MKNPIAIVADAQRNKHITKIIIGGLLIEYPFTMCRGELSPIPL